MPRRLQWPLTWRQFLQRRTSRRFSWPIRPRHLSRLRLMSKPWL